MLVNENRGSYGMFSRAGRSSTEKFHILMKKDEILNGTGKKFKPPDLFSQAKEEALKYRIEAQDEPQEIFLMEENFEEKPKEKKAKKKPEKISQYKKSEVYMEKFIDIRNKNKRLNLTPSCTKYDPRNGFIWKKARQFPTWESSVPKYKSIKPKEIIQPKFYKNTNFKIESKNFVDMSRQTNRKSFIEVKNYHHTDNCFDEDESNYFNSNITSNLNNLYGNELNKMTAKTQANFANYHSERKSLKSAGLLHRNKKLDLHLIKKKGSKQSDNLSGMDLQNTNSQIINNNDNKLFFENSPKNNYDENLSNSNNDFYNKNFKENSPKRKNISSMLKHRKPNKANDSIVGNNNYNSVSNNGMMRSSRSANPITNRRWNKIQAPDFKKVISRETRDKMYDDKKRVMPFSIPPYQKTRPSKIIFLD